MVEYTVCRENGLFVIFFDKFVIALFFIWQHNTSIDTAA